MKKLFSTLAISSLIFVFLLVGCDNRRQAGPQAGAGQTQTPTTPGRVGGPDTGIIEGTINGGGGRGMRCRGNGPETLESLDLFEAKALGLTLVPVPENEDKALDLGIELLARHMWTPGTIELGQYISILKVEMRSKWLTKIRYIESGQLRMIDDSHEVIKRAGCEPVQIAVYYESAILIDKKLWSQLDNLSKAAVWMHELAYHIERQSGRTNSISTRFLIGQLFSTRGSRPRMDGIPTDPKLVVKCGLWDERRSAGSVYAYEITRDQEVGTELVFEDLPNSSGILRKSAFFWKLTFAHLENPSEQNSFNTNLEVDSLDEDRSLRLSGTKENYKLEIYSSKTDKMSTLKLECQRRIGVEPTVAPANPRVQKTEITLPVAPPVIPSSVEVKSRYDGVGTYEKDATYNFRYMTHDVNVTRNNWDILFEARADLRDDQIRVNTVTDDDSFIFDLKSGEKGCEAVDPCEIEKAMAFVKENLGKKDSVQENRYANVAKGHCYAVASQDADGDVKVMFEVLDHQKSTSAVLGRIKIINSSTEPRCGK